MTMITTSQMYWLTRMDIVNEVCSYILLILILLVPCLAFVGYMIADSSSSDSRCAYVSWLKKYVILLWLFALMISTSVIIFMPTTKEMAAIIIVPKIANSEKVQTVGNKLYDLAVEWMDNLKPNNEKGQEK